MTRTKETNIFVLFFFIFFIAVGQLLYYIPGMESLSYIEYSIVGQLVYFIVPIALYYIITKKSVLETMRLKPLGVKNFILAVLFGFAIQPMMQLLSFFTSMFFPNVVAESYSAMEGSGLITSLLAIAVIPALLEEVTMRGIVLSGYKNQGSFKSIVYTSLLFGLLHMNPQQLPYAFAAGLFFCFLVDRSGSIWASVIPHFIVNATNITAAFSTGGGDAADITISNTSLLVFTGAYALITLPLLGLLIYFFVRLNPRSQAEAYTETRKKEKFFTLEIPIIFAVFIFFGIIPYIGYLF